MAVTEESRYQLFQRLEELLGPDKVATLMELLPPVGWADVATKRDLDHLHTLFDAKVDRLAVDLRAEIASGNQANRIFIENGRDHGTAIARHLTRTHP